MTRSHDEWAALAPGFALGILDPGEHAAFAEHLSDCLRCAADVRGYDRVADVIMAATPRVAPPPHLRAQLLEACRARPRVSVGTYAVAATVILAAGLAWYRSDDRPQPEVSRVVDAVSAE